MRTTGMNSLMCQQMGSAGCHSLKFDIFNHLETQNTVLIKENIFFQGLSMIGLKKPMLLFTVFGMWKAINNYMINEWTFQVRKSVQKVQAGKLRVCSRNGHGQNIGYMKVQ